MNSNQYAIKLVTYLLVLVVYFYEVIVYMLLERNAFDSIACFFQCIATVNKTSFVTISSLLFLFLVKISMIILDFIMMIFFVYASLN